MADGIPFGTDPAELAGLASKDQLLRQQLAQMMALQQRAPMQGYGLAGGIGAGLANLVQGLVGGIKSKDLRGDIQDNTTAQAQMRKALLDALAGDGTSGSTQPPAAPAMAAPPQRLGMMPQPQMSPGAHPLAIGQPVQEPGLAQLAALGIQRPPGAGPQQPAPQGAPAMPPAQPAPTGIEQLMALSQRDRAQGAKLLATGDPVLAHLGEQMLERAQREQQMGFQGQQAALDRETHLAAAMKPEFRFNPLGTGAASFDPRTGDVREYPMGGAQQAQGAREDPLIPYPVGSRPYKDVVDMGRQFEQSIDIARIPASLQQDVLRLQLGQNLQGSIQQAEQSGWSKPMRQMVAGELQRLVNGVAGSEGEMKSLAAKSGIVGGLQDIYNALAGDITGPQLDAYRKFVEQFASREHQLAYDRLGGYIDSTANGGAGLALKQVAPQYYEKSKQSALNRLASLGEVKAPAKQAPGSFDLERGGPMRKTVGGKTYEKRDGSWYEIAGKGE